MKNDVKKYNPLAERRYFTSAVDIQTRKKTADDDGDGNDSENVQTIKGYAAIFNSLTDFGYMQEQIDAKAFDGCDMSQCMCLFNHDENIVLGRNTVNLRLSVDDKGLAYACDLPDTSQAKDVGELIAHQIINKSSFAFIVAEDSVEYGEGNAPDIRTILKIKVLYDVSPVTYPAYDDTEVASRSIQENKPKIVSGQDIYFKIRKQKTKK